LEEAKKSGREIIIDVQNLKLITNIQYNKKMVEEKKKLIEKNKPDSMAKNIIMVFIDTVSRAHAHRKLKKTMQFLKKYADYNSEDYKK